MSGQHTPGPWRFSPWHIEEGPSAVYDANGDLVCTTSSDDTARLIAAAPELLAALKDMAHLAIQLGAFDLETREAFAVIAKAEGRA